MLTFRFLRWVYQDATDKQSHGYSALVLLIPLFAAMAGFSTLCLVLLCVCSFILLDAIGSSIFFGWKFLRRQALQWRTHVIMRRNYRRALRERERELANQPTPEEKIEILRQEVLARFARIDALPLDEEDKDILKENIERNFLNEAIKWIVR